MGIYNLVLSSPTQAARPASRQRRSFLITALILTLLTCAVRAQGSDPRVPIKVTNAALPITVGVPLGEAAGVTDAARLVLLDPAGRAVPAQTRVLARWRGAANDARYAIKWVLVDFKPAAAGTYTLSTAGSAPQPASAITVSDFGTGLRVSSSRVTLDFTRQGTALVTSLRIDSAEQLKAPLTFEAALPRGGIVALVNSADTLTVSETGLLRPGDTVRFEHLATLWWAAAAGDSTLTCLEQEMPGNRRYLIEPGTPRQEEVLVAATDGGKLMLSAPLRFAHAAGSVVRDLTAEQETAVIKALNGQTVTFTAPLAEQHRIGDAFSVANAASAAALASVERTYIEEQGALRTVVLQEGHFAAAALGGVVDPTLKFTIRYYIYADQPFIRVRVRLMNEGPFGFGAWRYRQGVFATHLLVRRLSAVIPTVSAGTGSLFVTDREDAYARAKARWAGPTATAGAMEISVPEFAENYPKGLAADAAGLRFDLLPDVGYNYRFDGARARTTDFYLGQQTAAALALTNQLAGVVDPAYVARTGAIRPLLVERRNWSQAFSNDPELAEAAMRAERWLAVGYDVTAADENWRIPATSIFEYRWRDESGANLGWRNFGDLAWGDGYCNLHYDIPFILLREFARTGDARAFQAGSETARYRSDWGQYHADDYWDSSYNMRGFAFYEKADHGSDRMPQPTHSWSEGLWLYWVLTGDESVHESALEAAAAAARIVNYGYVDDNALYYNESRWIGWPALNLIVAYRYTGDSTYLDQCRKAVYMLVQAEEEAGSKGYYLSPADDSTRAWMWAGYSALGAIEYYRETADSRTASYLVRQAEWLIGQRGDYPVLVGGSSANGRYQPFGMPYSWSPGKASATPTVELGMMTLPTLVTAARITGRADFRDAARRLFRDVAFYRDFDAGPVDPASRSLISFRSHQYGASSPKVYGHTGLTLSEYLPDLVGALVPPGRAGAPGTTSPLLNDTTARTATVEQTLTVVLNKTDASGQPLQLSAANLPAGASFDATGGIFSFTPSAAQAGRVFQVIFTGQSAQATLTVRLDIIVQADDRGPRVLLTSPIASDRLVAGGVLRCEWVVASNATMAKFQIRLSTDGGATYPTVVADLPGNAQGYDWSVPDSLASQRRAGVRLLLVATDTQGRVGLDFTRQDLTIAGTLGVVNAASYKQTLAPGALLSAFGTQMVSPETVGQLPSPQVIQGTRVDIVDSEGRAHQALLYYAGKLKGYDQVNFYLPENVALGRAVLTITSGQGEVSQAVITIEAVAPAVFTASATGLGDAAVISTTDGVNYNFGSARQDAGRDVYVSLFGTGWRFAGQTANAARTGGVAANNYEAATGAVTVEINGRPAEVLYAGPQIEYLGLDQINFRLPRDLAPGSYSMVVKIGTRTSNLVQLRVQ